MGSGANSGGNRRPARARVDVGTGRLISDRPRSDRRAMRTTGTTGVWPLHELRTCRERRAGDGQGAYTFADTLLDGITMPECGQQHRIMIVLTIDPVAADGISDLPPTSTARHFLDMLAEDVLSESGRSAPVVAPRCAATERRAAGRAGTSRGRYTVSLDAPPSRLGSPPFQDGSGE